MHIKKNKWISAAIPALMIHCSIGTVYCWSTFKENVATVTNNSAFATGWAFSFAIFFLGMSAAFGGSFVEKNIHKSSLLSAVFFSTGLLGTGLSIRFLQGVPALVAIYLFYGCIMGTGLGIGYLTPVKTLMLWFEDNKGLATGISIMGFGLAKMIATPMMEMLQNKVGISNMFLILSAGYFIVMYVGHLLLCKPDNWNEPQVKFTVDLSPFKDKFFCMVWLTFFLNIHCGLMLISYEKQLLGFTFIGMTMLPLIYKIIPSMTAFFNAAGRIGYSTLSDKLKQRTDIYLYISILSILMCSFAVVSNIFSINGFGIVLIIMLCFINANYGGGFSTLPTVLADKYGMKDISKIHGLTLSAWAVAGITGNNMSAIILNYSNNNYIVVLCVALILFIIQICVIKRMKIVAEG